MTTYLVVHSKLPEQSGLSDKVKANMTEDAQWLYTWVQLNEEGKTMKLYCKWEAKSPEAIKEVFKKVPELPADGIYPMTEIDPTQ
jgi:hypothetical protein